MKTSDLFPKKLTVLSLIILGSTFGLLLFTNSRNASLVNSFYTKDVPGFQVYCGASRLIAINQVLERSKSPDGALMKLNQQGILFSLNELKMPIRSEKVTSIRHKLENNEDILQSGDLEILKTDMQDYIENYLRQKNRLFEEQTHFSNVIAMIGLGGILMFFGFMLYVYYLYRKNLDALIAATNDLEEQRIASMHASKMASLGEMAGGIAHEINNPLAIISSTSKYLKKCIEKDRLTPEILVGCLGDIDSTVQRISKIIVGMRNISRATEQETRESTVVDDILTDVLGVCSERFKIHQVGLYIEDGDDLKATSLTCNRVQVSQVILNLLVNAFDAVEGLEDRWVKVKLTKDADYFIIKVIDSGRGISQETLEKVFQPFFTTKEIGKGTGLGLSLSRSIIERHMGLLSIDMESANTTFVIQLPLSPRP